MENKKTLYVILALVGGIMAGYMFGGTKIQTQNQGAATLSSNIAQESLSADKNINLLNSRVGNPTTPAVYPTFTVLNIDEEELAQAGPNNDTGIFSFKIRIKANNGDIYIPNNINMFGSSIPATNLYSVEKQGYGQVNQNTAAAFITISGTNLDHVTNNYHIEWGDSENFVVTIATSLDDSVDSVINGGDFRGILNTLRWNASNNPFVYSDLSLNLITAWITLN